MVHRVHWVPVVQQELELPAQPVRLDRKVQVVRRARPVHKEFRESRAPPVRQDLQVLADLRV